MADYSITKSILSVSSPGVAPDPVNDDLTVSLARRCNDFAAGVKRDHPEKFGFFASLPLPNVPASLEAIRYAFDDLHADGIGLLTNYNGTYVGAPELNPVFEELNKRKAIVFIHPSCPCIAPAPGTKPSRGTEAAPLITQYPAPMFEYFFDASRAVLNLFFTGTIKAYPDIQYILTHAGNVLPPLIERVTKFNDIVTTLPKDVTTQMMIEEFNKRFTFDLAGYPFPDQVHAMRRFGNPNRVVYGSDYPFTPAPVVEKLLKEMDEGLRERFHGDQNLEEEMKAIWDGNAKKLLGF